MTTASSALTVRPFTEADRPFLQTLVRRLDQGNTPAGRDPALMADYYRRLTDDPLTDPPGTETFVAVGDDGVPLGAVLNPSEDPFTRRPRAYLSILAVGAEAEGRGVGTALVAHAEEWAHARGCDRVDLDVFVTNKRAIAFYEHLGYRIDTLMMVKRLSPHG